MVGFLTVIHVLVCVILIAVILMQSGRGGGLAEGFGSAESVLGTQTNMVMVKITAVLGLIFLSTCLSLALLSRSADQSLMANLPEVPATQTVDVDDLFNQEPDQTITIDTAPSTETGAEAVVAEPVEKPVEAVAE